MTSIKEIDENIEEVDDIPSTDSILLKKSTSCLFKDDSLISENTIQRNYSMPNIFYEPPIQSQLDSFLRAAKLGIIEEIQNLLENTSSEIDLINKHGKCGWNALHYAIFYRKQSLAMLFINKYSFSFLYN